jgi:hypothetical protein
MKTHIATVTISYIPTPQHLFNNPVIIRIVIAGIRELKSFPMIPKYLLEALPVNPLFSSQSSTPSINTLDMGL